MRKNTIMALEKLRLTREEAQEWIEMLNEKEHSNWNEVVKRHTSKTDKIVTKNIICYKNEDGTMEYHKCIYAHRFDQIYAIQVGTAPKSSNTNTPYYLMRIKDEATNVSYTEALSLQHDGWRFIETEEACWIYNQLSKDDSNLLQILNELGVPYKPLDAFKTWYKDTSPNKRHKFNVRLFKPVSEITLSE